MGSHVSPREKQSSPSSTNGIAHAPSPRERQSPPSTNGFAHSPSPRERQVAYADDESVDSEEELTFVAPGKIETYNNTGGYRDNEYNGYNATKDFGGHGYTERYNGYDNTGKYYSGHDKYSNNLGYNNSGYNNYFGGGTTMYNTELETESGQEDSIFASRTLEEKIRGL